MKAHKHPQLKPMTLVRIGKERRRWIVLPVTRLDIIRGLQVDQPGNHLFTGYWYFEHGWNRTPSNHRTPQAYGKVIDLSRRQLRAGVHSVTAAGRKPAGTYGRVGQKLVTTGTAPGHFAVRKHCT